MVVDEKTRVNCIARDIRHRVMVLNGVDTLLLLVGRADVKERLHLDVVLEQLQQSCEMVDFQGKIIIAGPLLISADNARFCQILIKVCKHLRLSLQGNKKIHFCDAGDPFLDKFGVVPQLLDQSRLTLDSRTELINGFLCV